MKRNAKQLLLQIQKAKNELANLEIEYENLFHIAVFNGINFEDLKMYVMHNKVAYLKILSIVEEFHIRTEQLQPDGYQYVGSLKLSVEKINMDKQIFDELVDYIITQTDKYFK